MSESEDSFFYGEISSATSVNNSAKVFKGLKKIKYISWNTFYFNIYVQPPALNVFSKLSDGGGGVVPLRSRGCAEAPQE